MNNNSQAKWIFWLGWWLALVLPLPLKAADLLASHQITITGKVVTPECVAQLVNPPIRFNRQSSVLMQKGEESLPLTLRFSHCLFTGVGIKFRAERLANSLWQGAIRNSDNQLDTNWFYSIGPQTNSQFQLMVDSAPFASEQQSHYYRLDESQYWYQPEQQIDDEGIELPMQVTLHKIVHQAETSSRQQSLAHFVLTLSYR